MTFFVVKQCLKQGLCNEEDIVNVSRDAVLLGGTTAYLKTNDQLKLIDLLYGMMLPSGNDAAYTLAEYCGGVMLQNSKTNKKEKTDKVIYFIKQMNFFCKKLGFKSCKFFNPHGLSHHANQASVIEIGKLGGALIRKPLALKIVGTAKYSCEVRNKGVSRKLT